LPFQGTRRLQKGPRATSPARRLSPSREMAALHSSRCFPPSFFFLPRRLNKPALLHRRRGSASKREQVQKKVRCSTVIPCDRVREIASLAASISVSRRVMRARETPFRKMDDYPRRMSSSVFVKARLLIVNAASNYVQICSWPGLAVTLRPQYVVGRLV
jgi:hypothetical protein